MNTCSFLHFHFIWLYYGSYFGLVYWSSSKSEQQGREGEQRRWLCARHKGWGSPAACVESHGGLTLLTHTKKSLSVFFFLFIIASPPCRHLTAAVAQCAAGALVPVGPWQHHRHLGCGTWILFFFPVLCWCFLGWSQGSAFLDVTWGTQKQSLAQIAQILRKQKTNVFV